MVCAGVHQINSWSSLGTQSGLLTIKSGRAQAILRIGPPCADGLDRLRSRIRDCLYAVEGKTRRKHQCGNMPAREAPLARSRPGSPLPTKTYAWQDHIIEVRSYPDGWWRKYEAILDDSEMVVAGYDSPNDAFLAAQARIKSMDREEWTPPATDRAEENP
jgi:hypothetical protein